MQAAITPMPAICTYLHLSLAEGGEQFDVMEACGERFPAQEGGRVQTRDRFVLVTLLGPGGTARAHVLTEGDRRPARRTELLPVVSDVGALVGQLRATLLVVYPLPFEVPASLSANAALLGWPQDQHSVLIGHRGSGSTWRRLGVAENTMVAFQTAFRQGLRWAEFDVQLTRDKIPVLFHDVTMAVSRTASGPIKIALKEVDSAQLPSLSFRPPHLSVSPKRHASDLILPINKAREGPAAEYSVYDPFPCLSLVLQESPAEMGFNVEIKFAEMRAEEGYFIDRNEYVNVILDVVFKCGAARKIVFSSFDPDICLLTKMKQSVYPVFFLTEGGVVITEDVRKDSLEAAMDWALYCKLDGVVADVTSVLPHRPQMVKKMHKRGLLFFTYGALNNDPVFVRRQCELKVNGIITDTWRVMEK